MSYINKCFLMGNLGQHPEIQDFQNGDRVAKLSLATAQSYKDKNGNWQKLTEWHKIVIYNQNIVNKIVGSSLTVGSKIYVEGSVKTRQYTDSNNVKKSTTEVVLGKYDGTLLFVQIADNGTQTEKHKQENIETDVDNIPF